jgi:hypothetical protein
VARLVADHTAFLEDEDEGVLVRDGDPVPVVAD